MPALTFTYVEHLYIYFAIENNPHFQPIIDVCELALMCIAGGHVNAIAKHYFNNIKDEIFATLTPHNGSIPNKPAGTYDYIPVPAHHYQKVLELDPNVATYQVCVEISIKNLINLRDVLTASSALDKINMRLAQRI